LACNRSSYLF